MLLRGCPPLPFLVGGSSPLPLLQALRWERVFLLGGCPPLPFLVGGGSPSLPILQSVRKEHELLLGGIPFSSISWMRTGDAHFRIVVSTSVSWICALLVGGSSPLPPLLDAGVKRALPFGGFPLLFLGLAARGGCALPVPFPCSRLCFVGVNFPRGLLGFFPTSQGTCGGYVVCRSLPRQ